MTAKSIFICLSSPRASQRLLAVTLLVVVLVTPHSTQAQSLWSNSVIPVVDSAVDANAYELGVKFRTATNGFITGIRFYKGTNNTGTHVGSLWTSGGVKLGSVTFSNETAGGWQQQSFTSPLPVTSNITYVASYFAPNGSYSVDVEYFATQGVTNGSLRALASGEDGGNGVYALTATSAFPSSSFNAANYWVDLVFLPATGPDTNPPTIADFTPPNGATNLSLASSVTVTFNEGMNVGTVGTNTVELRDSLSNVVTSAVSYEAGLLRATLQPAALLGVGQSYTARVKGGVNGVKDLAGNALAADATWTFTTTAVVASNLWSNAVVPGTASAADTNAYELGVKFESALGGYVKGVRFYKGPGNPGPHVGNLWTLGGSNLASVVFTGESGSGWQEQMFAAPVAIQAGTVYVASYHAPLGGYALDGGYFAVQGQTNYPLRSLADGEAGGNGVFSQSAVSAFPTNSFNAANYWVDVVYVQTVGPDTNAPTVVSVTPTNGATNVNVSAAVTAKFSEAMTVATITTNTFILRNAASNVVAASLSYNAGTLTATLQPTSALSYGQTYTATVKGGPSGVKDLATNALAVDRVWSFTTQPPDTTAPTIVSVSPTNGATGVALSSAIFAVFNEGMNGGTVGTNTMELRDGLSNVVASAVSYEAGLLRATLQPAALLGVGQSYTARVKGGVNGVKDLAGNPLAADVTWTFTTTAVVASNLWSNAVVPGTASAADTNAYELGVKFESALGGYVKGVRFYKGPGNPGLHVGNLWTLGGSNLASVVFTNESVSGWQEQLFAAPVAIQAGTVYVASYHAPLGGYALDGGYFAVQGQTNYPLRSLADGEAGGNGVFSQSAVSAFPTNSFNAANYWVDVVYAYGQTPPIALNALLATQEDTATNVVLQGSDADGPVTYSLVAAPTNGLLSNFNTNTGFVTYRPATNYFGPDAFRYRVSDGSLFATGLVSLIVAPVNDRPTANNFAVTVPEDLSTNIVLQGSDIDSPVTYALLTGPANGTLSGFNTNSGQVTYTPTANFFGADAFTYRVSDGSLFATGTVSVTVSGTDDPAQAVNQAITVPKDTSTNLVLRAVDVDGTNAVSAALAADGTNVPSNWILNAGATKVIAVAADDGDSSYLTSGSTANTIQQFTVANPVHLQPGDVINSISLRATCRRFTTPSGSYVVSAVLGANVTAGTTRSTGSSYADSTDAFTSRPGGGAWTLADVENLQIRIQNTQARDIACTKFDAIVNFNGNTNRVYTILSAPAHGALSTLNTNNGVLSYTPTLGYTGADSFTFRVNAGGVLSTGVVSISVVGTNSVGPIVANPIGAQAGGYGTNFSFTFPTNTFTDADSPVLTYSATGMPPGISFTNASRTFAGIPTTSGSYPVSLVAADNSLPPLTATNTFAINITRASLTVTARSTNKPYGVPFSFAGNEFTPAGLKFSDVVSSASLASAGAPAIAAAGAYAITVTNASGTVGLTNYIIGYVNGTLTVNPSAPYAITSITFTNGAATLTWQSITGRHYRLEFKDGLTVPAWTEVPVDIVGAGPTTSVTNATGGATNRFYRVK